MTHSGDARPKDTPDTEAAGGHDLDSLRRQDHAAFTTLVREHHVAMRSIARSIAGDWADEVVQDAWLSIYRALPGFEGRSALKTWLFSIVRNQSIARLRKERRVVSLDSLQDDSRNDDDSFTPAGQWRHPPEHWSIDSPEGLMQETELRHCMEQKLENLSADQRAVFTLRDLQQLPAEEICNILEISASNYRVLLHRARKHLMQAIEHYQRTGHC